MPLKRTMNVWGRFDVKLSGGRLMFRVIERMINQKSVKEISKMLNLNSDTVRRYEYRVFHILNRDSKIRKYKTSK